MTQGREFDGVIITKPTGDKYETDAKGNFIRSPNGLHRRQGDWVMLGLDHVKRCEFVPFIQIPERLPTLDLLYKNGNPQWTVRDLDHGSTRVWGNTSYHGVKNITIKWRDK